MGKPEQPPRGASSTSPQETAAERTAAALAYIQKKKDAILVGIGEADSVIAVHKASRHVHAKNIPGFRLMSKKEKIEIDSSIDAANELIDDAIKKKQKEFSEAVAVEPESSPVEISGKTIDVIAESGAETGLVDMGRREVFGEIIDKSGFIAATADLGDSEEVQGIRRGIYVDILEREPGSDQWSPEEVFNFLVAEEDKRRSQIVPESDHSAPGGEQPPEKQTAQAGEITEEAAPIPDASEKAPEAVADDQEGIASALLADEDPAGSVWNARLGALKPAGRNERKSIPRYESAKDFDGLYAILRERETVSASGEAMPSEEFIGIINDERVRIGKRSHVFLSPAMRNLLKRVSPKALAHKTEQLLLSELRVSAENVPNQAGPEAVAKQELKDALIRRDGVLFDGLCLTLETIVKHIREQLGRPLSSEEVDQIKKDLFPDAITTYLEESGSPLSFNRKERLRDAAIEKFSFTEEAV